MEERRYNALELLPEVVVMDVGMPDLNGIEATRQIVANNPKVKVIGLSMHSAKRFVIEMFKAGASGYLLKDCAFEELANAIRAVVLNRTYLSPKIADTLIEDYLHLFGKTQLSVFSLFLAHGNARYCSLSPKAKRRSKLLSI